MANPKSPDTLDYWVTDQIWPNVSDPKSGDTGTLNSWITDQIWFQVYTEAAGISGIVIGLDIA